MPLVLPVPASPVITFVMGLLSLHMFLVNASIITTIIYIAVITSSIASIITTIICYQCYR